ncbi:MAG: thioredoxin [Candidatus Omnitrophica bacterium]|nr:thioredoxin [Candidatus Omnitrophota bacterium]
MPALHFDEGSFQKEVMESPVPVLVDFWAEWCGPCRMMGPVIDQVAEEMSGKIKVGKINVDEAQQLASQFNVMSIPTLILFKNGKVAEQFVGAMPKEALLNKIKAKI